MTDPYDESHTETQPESGWIYVAPVNVQHSTGRVEMPDGLFDAGIVEEEALVNWAYERVTGVVIVSNESLEDEEYHNVGERKIYTNGYCQVPEPFFPPNHDARTEKIAKSVHEKAYVRRDQRRHFVYQVGMDDGEKRSCYLLTDEELQDRLSGPDDWVGNFESKPQFF